MQRYVITYPGGATLPTTGYSGADLPATLAALPVIGEAWRRPALRVYDTRAGAYAADWTATGGVVLTEQGRFTLNQATGEA